MGRIAIVLLCVCLCFGLCGCDLWMEGSYAHVSPHEVPNDAKDAARIEVSSYQTLYDALCDIVESGTTGATVYYPDENRTTVQAHMEAATRKVCTSNPIGNYAVEKITYEVGTKGGVQAIAVQISYNRTLSDILYMHKVAQMSEGAGLIYDALAKCRPSATFFVAEYTQTDLVQLVKNYVDANPDVCMEIPQVTVMTYPQEGAARVIEVLFAYKNSRDDLRVMQQTVDAVFDSAILSVSQNATDREKCTQLYRFLMLHYNPDTLNTSITPAYSLLHYKVGDSKAYAIVYAAMCRKVGVNCSTVVGTKDGTPYYWNAVKSGEEYLFVDLLQCARQGGFQLSTKDQMRNYVWDYSAYGG